MKTLVLAGTFVALASLPVNPVTAQLRPPTIYCASEAEYRVTASRSGEQLTTLHIPPGTYLSVTGYLEKPLSVLDTPTLVYHGDVTVRLRAASQVHPAEGNVMNDIMALAPIVIQLKDVDVEVEIIDPASN